MSRNITRLLAAFCAATIVFACGGAARAAELPTDRPLTLEECIETALGGHPKIKGAEQDLVAGEKRTRQAIAAFWPQASFQANRNFIVFQRQIRIGNLSLTTSADYISNNFTFDTTWKVFDFGRTYYNVKSLAELEGSLLSSLDASQQKVAYDVMDSYFGLLRAQSLVKVANETQDAAKAHLDQAQAFFDAGVKPRFDVTTAEVELNNARLGIIRADNAVKVARAVLNTRLGADPLTPVSVVDRPELDELERPLKDYQEEALANRPEIKGLEATVRSSEMAVKAAWSEFLPELSASAEQNWYKEDHTDTLSNQSVVVAVTVPLFEGFRRPAKIGETRATVLSNGYRLEDLKLDVMLEVSQAYIDVEDLYAAVKTLKSSVEKARENLDIAQGRYEAGVGTLVDVTDAQVELTRAQSDLTSATYDHHRAFTRLLRSVGKYPGAGREDG